MKSPGQPARAEESFDTDSTAVSTHESVLIVYGTANHAQRYRCLHVQEQLGLFSARGCVRHSSEVRPSDAKRCKAVILHRVSIDRHVSRLVLEARRQGSLTVFDTDDLVFESPACDPLQTTPSENTIETALHRDETQRYCRMMELADAVLVSTEYLAQRVARFGKPAYVHRNAFSLEMLSLSELAYGQREPGGRRLVIGYASGTPTHERDFQQVKPALQHILSTYPDTELWVIGHLDPGAGWDGVSDRVKHLPFVPWEQLPSLLAQFDINIAPLEPDNPFCQAKSEVKYVEAGLVRVPTVASRADAFTYAITPGDNGFLAATTEEWTAALQQLVENAGLRREMGERAYANVLARYHPLVRGRELVGTLNEINRKVHGEPLWADGLPHLGAVPSAGHVSGDVACGETTGGGQRSLLRRAEYALRNRGVRVFLMQAWVYLRSRLAESKTGHRADRQGQHDRG